MEDQPRADGIEDAEEKLRRAEDADDETRLETLTEVHEDLERELDRDVDETPPPGR
jgi:hypothetical protein